MTYRFGDNVLFVKNESPELFKEYICSEKNVYTHPYLTLSRLRVIFEELTNRTCEKLSLCDARNEVFAKKLTRLRGKVPDNFVRGMESLRPVCNAASHELISSELKNNKKVVDQALLGLALARDFAYWYYSKLMKDLSASPLPSFVSPPLTSFEEELRWAHDGDAYAALAVAEYHRNKSFHDEDMQLYHDALFNVFLDYSCEKGIVEALEWKSNLLVTFGENKGEIRKGIEICDMLIENGVVINAYLNKSIAFARMNRKHTAINFARKGVEAGDPYAINLYVQWSGFPEHDIDLSNNECIELLKKSISIAFNSEAAYYLSLFYQDAGEFSKAIELLEESVTKSSDTRALLERQLGSILLKSVDEEEIRRGVEFLLIYAKNSFFSEIEVVKELALAGRSADAIKLFIKSIVSADDSQIVQCKKGLEETQSLLISCDGVESEDLKVIFHCLDGV